MSPLLLKDTIQYNRPVRYFMAHQPITPPTKYTVLLILTAGLFEGAVHHRLQKRRGLKYGLPATSIRGITCR